MKVKNRVKELRFVKAAELIPNAANWRTHSREQADALKGILAEIGYADAILARETPDGLQILDGHLRASTTPDMEVPVLVLDLTEDEGKKLLLTLDPLAAMAGKDDAKLQELLAGVSFQSKAIGAMLENIAGQEAWQAFSPAMDAVHEDEPPIDKAAELQKKWQTERGQLWQAGPHRIWCGDSREVPAELFNGNKIRLIWTDPPYGVSYGAKNEFLNAIAPANRIQTPISGDHLKPDEVRALFVGAMRAAVARAETGMAVYVAVPPGPLHKEFMLGLEEAGIAYKHQLAWVKNQFVIGRSDYHYRHEPILYGWLENGAHLWNGDRSQDSVFEVDKPHVSDLHPTTKPVELVARMIHNSSQPADIVYDPFAGSGTTIVAAHQLERIGYGAEVDAGYVAVCLERLAALGIKPKLISG